MGKLDEAGGLIRRLIGGLADDTDVYLPFGAIEAGREGYPGMELLSSVRPPRFRPPPGTDVGFVRPYELIGKAVYPEDIRRAAERRTLGSTIQRPFNHTLVPLYVRPQAEVKPGVYGSAVSRPNPDTGELDRVLDIAGLATGDDPLRVLIHEARHAIQNPDLNDARALRSISSYRAPGIEGRILADESRRYLARPDELVTHIADAGDDFVRKNGRLVENVRDVNNVIEMLEAGEASPTLHPLARQLYVESYRNSPQAREHINNVLTRYFAVPGVVAAGAAVDGQPVNR